MIAHLRRLGAGLSPELELLRNRMAIGGASGLCCLLFGFDLIVFAAILGYLFCNAGLFWMQKHGIWRAEDRCFAAIMLDATLALTVMLRAPESMSVFYPLMLLMTLSTGFRFGIRWLFIASIASTLTFGIVVLGTAYWQNNLAIGLGLVLALIAIPAYCSTLIHKISLAKEEADAASKAKSYFLASVSHELRTPLNAIIGYGNHLRQSEMPRNQREMVEASVLAGEHLLHLIEQLIEVAKTGAGSATVKTSSFRPSELLAEIRDIMAVRVEDKGLKFNLQATPQSDHMVDGPTDVIRNILLNLVGNALKFTEAGSISLKGGFVVGNGESRLWFSVTDTGIGIAESAVDRIFQPFQQADETVLNRFGGTGLGLAICKQLVEQVNGNIQVQSTLGWGSTFRIEVPVQINETIAAEPQQYSDNIFNILTLGSIDPALLANVQAQDNVVLRHIRCPSANNLATTINELDLSQFNIVLIAQNLATEIEPDSPIWKDLSDAEIAPIIASETSDGDLGTFSVFNPFASILSAQSTSADIQSAVRIASSFGRHLHIGHNDQIPAVSIYTPRKILVADDNRTNRDVLRAVLGSVGHDVKMASDGDDALEALEKGDFDILLLDVNMPRLNGIDACKMWRASEQGLRHLPIVGVTADATRETEIRCIDAGMDARITKPVDAKLLLATIEQLCGPAGEKEPPIALDAANVVVPITRIAVQDNEVMDQHQLDYLMSIGDDSFVRSMIEGFFEDADQTLGPLRKAVSDGSIQDFKFCAHAIKSSCHNMGAKPLAELCGKFELISDSEFDEHRLAYLATIEAEMAKVIEALQALLLHIEEPATKAQAGL